MYNRRYTQGTSNYENNYRSNGNYKENRNGNRNINRRSNGTSGGKYKTDRYYKKDKRSNNYEYKKRNNRHSNGGKNRYINDLSVKYDIIDYVYSSINVSKYRYKMIEYMSDLYHIKENSYSITPNYNGINSLMIFIKLADRYFSVILDRKTLSYNKDKLDYDKIKIIDFTMRFDESIYKGTIIDGVLLYNTTDNNDKVFMINDVYYFKGKNIKNDKYKYKIMNINSYLEKYYKKDNTDSMNNINLMVNTIYDLSDLKELVDNYIPKSKLKSSIKGIDFYPELSGQKLIYLFSNSSKDSNVGNETISAYNNKTIRPSNINICGTDNITAVFRIKKTDKVDVYNLYLGKQIIKNDKKCIKYTKICIAYIPTTNCSYFCKDIFNNTLKNTALVRCKYILNKDKWVPYELVTDKKIPDSIDIIQNTDN